MIISDKPGQITVLYVLGLFICLVADSLLQLKHTARFLFIQNSLLTDLDSSNYAGGLYEQTYYRWMGLQKYSAIQLPS